MTEEASEEVGVINIPIPGNETIFKFVTKSCVVSRIAVDYFFFFFIDRGGDFCFSGVFIPDCMLFIMLHTQLVLLYYFFLLFTDW